jgi:hypothetical protein
LAAFIIVMSVLQRQVETDGFLAKHRSAAARKAQSARMKKYWATLRKQKST